MKNQNPNLIHEAKIFDSCRNVAEGTALKEQLYSMARSEYLEREDCLLLADQIMAEVDAYEAACDAVSEDIGAVMDGIFEKLDELEPEKRLDLMDQMIFGLSLYTEEELLGKLKGGVSGEMLYREIHGEPAPYSPEAEAERRRTLRQMAANVSISPAALGRIHQTLCSSGDVVAASAALGRDGYTLKCVTAMDHYLKNREHISPEEAAVITCTRIDLEAIDDAVSVGEIAEAVAYALVAIRVLVLFARVVKLIVAAKTIGEIFLVTIAGILVMEGTMWVGSAVSRLIGQGAVIGTELVKSGAEYAAAGIERIRAHAENAAVQTETAVNAPVFEQAVEEACI